MLCWDIRAVCLLGTITHQRTWTEIPAVISDAGVTFLAEWLIDNIPTIFSAGIKDIAHPSTWKPAFWIQNLHEGVIIKTLNLSFQERCLALSFRLKGPAYTHPAAVISIIVQSVALSGSVKALVHTKNSDENGSQWTIKTCVTVRISDRYISSEQ